jgi:predicted transcriptional regulator
MNIIGKKKTNLRSQTFNITPTGMERLEKMNGTGLELRILGTLAENGPLTILEIDRNVGTKDPYKIEQAIVNAMELGVISGSGGK